MGALWNHSTGASDAGLFDNIYIPGSASTSSDTTSIFTKIDVPLDSLTSLADTQSEDTVLFSFSVTDSGNADGVATIIDSLIIRPGAGNQLSDWTQVIAGARITNKRSPSLDTTGQIASDRIVFKRPGSSLVSVKNGVSERDSFYVHMYLKNSGLPDTLDNRRLHFSLSVDDIYVKTDSSKFHTTTAAVTDSVIIKVTATELQLRNIPASVLVNNDFTLAAQATDINGNRDYDQTGNVTLSRLAGSGTLSSVAGLTQSLTSGFYRWNDLRLNAVETGVTIQTSNALGLTNATTSAFNVTEFFEESFSDSDFTYNPVWNGDTDYWQIVTSSDAAAGASNSYTLRLNAPAVTDSQYISTQISNWGNKQQWGFFIGRRGNSFTNANKMYIWLYANESNLESATVDGYRLRIGDDSGNDEIVLQEVTNGVGTTILTSSGVITNGLNDIGFLVRVTRTPDGLFTLYTSTLPTVNGSGAVATDTANSANTTVNQGSATNTTYSPSSNGYFGVGAVHSTGAAATTAVELDQIRIIAENVSVNSDIIAAGSEVSNIDYSAYQSASITATGDGLRVWSFTIRDGGTASDGDAYGTILNSVSIDKGAGNSVSSWANTIQRAALFDGSTLVAEIGVTGETIVFSGLSGSNVTAPDNGSKTLDLYLTFESAVTDNQQFQFRILSASALTAETHSSSFTASFRDSSAVTGDLNRIEVTASELRFSGVPTSAIRNSNFSATVSATDALGNTDSDQSVSVTLSLNSGTGTLSSTGGLSRSLSSGTQTWSDLQYDTEESGVTIKTTNSGGLTEDTTDAIDVAKGLRDDFTDGDFTNNPTWSGSTASYAVSTSGTLPSGSATTDGSFLASNASVGYTALVAPSVAVDEWKFSLGSPNFDPSSANYIGAILMSSAAISGDIITASWNGYYIRIGVNSTPDPIELWRSDGTTKTKVGDFPGSPSFSTGGLRNGLNLRITRNASGQFEVFYSTGFTYSGTPTTSAGTLTDNTYSSSSYFGVYTHFDNPDASRRVYIDNIFTGALSSDATSSITKINTAIDSISSLVDTQTEDTVLFAFMLKDSASGDELATIIDSLHIKPGTGNQTGDWTTLIGGARLTNTHGENLNVSGSIRSDKIVFSGSPLLRIADGSQDSLYLHVYLRKAMLPDTVDNNLLVFSLSANDLYGPQDSSRFAPSSPTISDSVIIDVDATKIALAEEPTGTYYGQTFSMKAYTADENGTRDENSTASVTLQLQVGSGSLSSVTGLNQTLVNGIFTWTDILYDGALGDSFSIRTTNGSGFINDTTDVIYVARPPVIISEYANDATGGEVIELMVVDGPLDLRGWAITDNEPSTTVNQLIDGNEGYYGFNDSYVWQYLPSGTVIRINTGSSSANDTTVDQKSRDFFIVQNTNQTSGLLITVDGTGANPNLNLSSNDNLLLVKDTDGNPENGYTNAVNALYWGDGSGNSSNDPYGPSSITLTGSGDNGYYLSSDTLDLGNYNASNWTTSTSELASATYGAANSNGTITQGLYTYQGTHTKVSNVNVTNFSGFGDQTITLNWTLPADYSKMKNNIYVIIDDDLPWITAELPVRFTDLSELAANTAYGSGYLFGSGSYLIARSDTNFVDVSALAGGGQNYYVRIYTIKDDFMYYDATDTYIFTSNQDNDVSLPVQLSEFKIEEIETTGRIRLAWRTESEIDNAYFLVQRMNADRQFETIAQIKGQGSKTSATDYEFVDETVQSCDTLVYRLADVAYDGTITYHEPKTLILRLPERFDLLPNYPNPFNPSTTIVYHLPETSDVTIRVYNALGQQVKTLLSRKDHAPGIHRLQWNGVSDLGTRVTSGLYIVRIQANHFSKSRKILLLK